MKFMKHSQKSNRTLMQQQIEDAQCVPEEKNDSNLSMSTLCLFSLLSQRVLICPLRYAIYLEVPSAG
jgi:hypothetical protein